MNQVKNAKARLSAETVKEEVDPVDTTLPSVPIRGIALAAT